MIETPDIIPVDYQVGITWKNDQGKVCTTIAGRPHQTTGKRMVYLSELTFVGGFAIGAMHYYARLKVHSPYWTEEGDADCCHGGYGGKLKPDMESISLDAKRVLTKVERDMNDDPIGKIGESTYRFNDEASAKAAAIALFKKRFGPGWVLVGEDMGDGDDYPVFAETSEPKPRKKRARKTDPKQKELLCTDSKRSKK